jgi:putative endonuclease
MEYFVYILYSQNTDRYYVGQTQNLEERLERHNSGRNKSTKPGIPWMIVHFEVLPDRSTALVREKYIKNLGSKRYLNLVNNDNKTNPGV